ncbi:hypothetical protein GM415_08005 [Pseudodesulfovibrio cashew]|uniref:Lipoprotein n=1 Tax=Pseudodesulfovibrio cashew TaxID=2678688 RepID=A0A6I6JD76_9BACT|nr:hypothetical protein [Pseudodesulfovibrio cashew]QGY40071.1 hypothetical protein GM415_08005 [Pseudodesulfovibrio cashew]
MKRILTLVAVLAMLMLAQGCKSSPAELLDLSTGPEYVGDYLEVSDVLRIGHALDTAETRQPVQWENPATGYQCSMMVFNSDAAMGTATRTFTVLTIAPDGNAEVLNLSGKSSTRNVWNIVALKPASPVGKASRMTLAASPVPEASLTGKIFNGFMVQE